jgi:two-component system cell cycle sensor histidine kinase/response regulator CckA
MSQWFGQPPSAVVPERKPGERELGQQGDHRRVKSQKRRRSAVVPVVLSFCATFVAEAIVMLVLEGSANPSSWGAALSDSLLLAVLILPVLYLVTYRPLAARLAEARHAEAVTRESEWRLVSIFDNVSLAGVMLDREGRVTYCNEALLKLIGRTSEDLVGQDWLEVFLPLERASAERREVLLTAIREGALPDQVENQLVTSSGERRLVAWSNTALRDEWGAIVGVASLGDDITQRRNAARLLQVSEARYRSLFENMVEGYAYCRVLFQRGEPSDFVYLDVNPAFETQTGLKDVVGRKVSEVIPGVHESNPELLEIYGRVTESGVPEQFETYLPGLETWFSVTVFRPMEGDFVATFENITDRKVARGLLRENEERYRTLFDANPQPMWVFDVETLRFLAVNDAAVAHYGYSLDEFLSMTIQAIRPAADLVHLQEALDHAEGSSGIDQSWARHTKRDGSLITVEITSHPLEFGGRPARLVLPHDVTERNQAEAAKEHLEAQLRQSQKMETVGQFAAGIAHDFNNNLAVVMGYAEIALAELDPAEPVRADIEEIRKAGERSATLTRQLLGFARMQPIVPKSLNLNEAIDSMLNMLVHLTGVGVCLEWIPDAQPCWVLMDPSQIDQILVNLVVNARDAAAGDGTITIATTILSMDEDDCEVHGDSTGQHVVLTVSDNGCGMDKATQERIFEPFFTTKPEGQGTGLGLSTIFGIVQQNHGFLNVESELGRGTTIEIHFPYDSDQPVAETISTPATVSPQASTVLKVVQEALGHSNISTTADVYAHLLPQLQRDAAERMDRALSGAQ